MLPAFLFPESEVTGEGHGPALALESFSGPLRLTLGITDVKEQQSLDVGVQTSMDGENWITKPVALFPQKFYAGLSTVVLPVESHSDARFLRVNYKTNRWGHWTDAAVFRFYVFAEPHSS